MAYVQNTKHYQRRLKSNWKYASDDGRNDEREDGSASLDSDGCCQRYEHWCPHHTRHTAVQLCHTEHLTYRITSKTGEPRCHSDTTEMYASDIIG